VTVYTKQALLVAVWDDGKGGFHSCLVAAAIDLDNGWVATDSPLMADQVVGHDDDAPDSPGVWVWEGDVIQSRVAGCDLTDPDDWDYDSRWAGSWRAAGPGDWVTFGLPAVATLPRVCRRCGLTRTPVSGAASVFWDGPDLCSECARRNAACAKGSRRR
jgi:hypothetical protein